MDNLRQLADLRMLQCGITQRQLAQQAGLKENTLSEFLLGSGMDQENVTKLCRALGELREHTVNASVLAEAEALAATG